MSDAKDNDHRTPEGGAFDEDAARRPEPEASERPGEDRPEGAAPQSEADQAAPGSEGGAAPDASEAPEPEPSPEELLERARQEAKENYANYLRAVADLDTYRRRATREKEELRSYAASELLEKLLPVYDNLCLGMESASQTNDPEVVVQGLQMVLAQFRNALEEHGVSEIAPEPGEPFDPNLHEAFQTEPSEAIEEGRVIRPLRKGFMLNGRLARPASVVVSGGSSGSNEAEAQNADRREGGAA